MTSRLRLVRDAAALLRNAVRRVPIDPTIEVVYTRAGSEAVIDDGGRALTAGPRRARTPVERDGKPVGALVHDPALLHNPERLRAAVEAASLAIDNERLKAELRAQLRDVQASRTRLVEAGDRERRRVERNLHDGAQQRLVGLALTLRLAGRQAQDDPAVTQLLVEALRELDDALEELRRLARGVHPAIVSDAGLVGALESLAERPGGPVELHVDVPTRLPDTLEVAAYYLVAEALANTAKHAAAGRVVVRVAVVGNVLRVLVSDDGRGGAAAAPGSGLEGLADRIDALGGTLVIDSPPGRGTTVSADLPLRLEAASGRPRNSLAALRWMGWENWEVPAELYDQITEEDGLDFAKGTLLCAGGATRITERERDWFIGYRAACGDSDRVVDAVRGYDDADRLEDIVSRPGMAVTVRGMLYDAFRLCSCDGAVTDEEHARLRQAAARLEVDPQVVTAIGRLVEDDHALRRRRYELISGPYLVGHPQASVRTSRGRGR